MHARTPHRVHRNCVARRQSRRARRSSAEVLRRCAIAYGRARTPARIAPRNGAMLCVASRQERCAGSRASAPLFNASCVGQLTCYQDAGAWPLRARPSQHTVGVCDRARMASCATIEMRNLAIDSARPCAMSPDCLIAAQRPTRGITQQLKWESSCGVRASQARLVSAVTRLTYMRRARYIMHRLTINLNGDMGSSHRANNTPPIGRRSNNSPPIESNNPLHSGAF
jgi:hypothetical protein